MGLMWDFLKSVYKFQQKNNLQKLFLHFQNRITYKSCVCKFKQMNKLQKVCLNIISPTE